MSMYALLLSLINLINSKNPRHTSRSQFMVSGYQRPPSITYHSKSPTQEGS